MKLWTRNDILTHPRGEMVEVSPTHINLWVKDSQDSRVTYGYHFVRVSRTKYDIQGMTYLRLRRNGYETLTVES